MFKGKTLKQKIIAILSLIAFLGCVLVLIVESSLDGTTSGNQSNTIGGGIADIINNNAGDQSKLVEPESLTIKNKADSISIGDEYVLSTSLLPENSSFKSITFESSNKDIATVNDEGTIKGLKEGSTTISAFSSSYPTIKDSFELKVNAIAEESIELSISNAKTVDGVYQLDKDRTYTLKTTFNPQNTTDKTVSYSTDAESNVLTISGENVYCRNSSDNKVYTITATSKNGKTSSISLVVNVSEVNVTPLTSISVSKSSLSLGVEQSKALSSLTSISFQPSNATYKSYKLTSSNPAIVKVSGLKLIGIEEGEAEITISSTIYPSISTQISVKSEYIAAKSLNVTLNNLSTPRIQIDNSLPLKISASPSNASCILGRVKDYVTFTSSDESILTVNESGTVTGIKKGTATITVNAYKSKKDKLENGEHVSKSIEIECFEPSEVKDFFFDWYTESSIDDEYCLYSGKSYSFSSLFRVTKLIGTDGSEIDTSKENISNELSFNIVSGESEASYYTFSKNTFKASEEHNFTIAIEVTHVSSGLAKSNTYTIVNQTELGFSNEDLLITSSASKDTYDGVDYKVHSKAINLKVNDECEITIQNRLLDSNQYSFYTSGTSTIILEQSSSFLKIRGNDEGLTKILIKNEYGSMDGIGIILYVHSYHLKATGFNIGLKDTATGQELDLSDKTDEEGNISLSAIVNSSLELNIDYIPSNNDVTLAQLEVDSSDTSIGTYSNSKLSFKKIGTVTYTVTEKISNVSHTITVYVVNHTALKNTGFTIKSEGITYDSDTKTYHLIRGNSAKINTIFTDDSTFTDVVYESSDESILKVGNDGMITPLKLGDCEIKATIKDGNTIDISYNVKITVDRKKAIDNLNNFFYKIRKGLGHFGAFLITGIFGMFFFLFTFKPRRYIFTASIAVGLGYLVAAFTEYIQTFVPGRNGNIDDVLLDFTGYSIGAGTVLIVFLAILLIRYMIERHKKKT